MPSIRMVDLRRQHRSLRQPIEAAVRQVLEDCDFVMGRAVAEFEADLSRTLGVRFAVGCASGTDALRISLMALEIGPGDEVVTTPFTFAAAVEAIVLQGARPVFADIDPRTCNLDPGRIEERITSRTRAILPVHLFGHPADMDPILDLARKKELRVIEDAAQAVGARYRGRWVGALGDIGCLSFYPAKHLGACGDGGALLTNDPELARRCRMISLHGSERRYRHEFPGLNSRLDTLQAAILRVKLSSSGVLDREAYPDCRSLRPGPAASATHPALPRSGGQTRLQPVLHPLSSPRRTGRVPPGRRRGLRHPLSPAAASPAGLPAMGRRQGVLSPCRSPGRGDPFPADFSGTD